MNRIIQIAIFSILLFSLIAGANAVEVKKFYKYTMGITGREVAPDLQSCFDSDSGVIPVAAGQVNGMTPSRTGSLAPFSYNDQCGGMNIPQNVLTEYYCKGPYVQSTRYTCPNGCLNGACISVPGKTSVETVTCAFSGNTAAQKCWSRKGTCITKDGNSCTLKVQGVLGEQVIWSSSCTGPQQTTTIDGKSETLTFSCNSVGVFL